MRIHIYLVLCMYIHCKYTESDFLNHEALNLSNVLEKNVSQFLAKKTTRSISTFKLLQ